MDTCVCMYVCGMSAITNIENGVIKDVLSRLSQDKAFANRQVT